MIFIKSLLMFCLLVLSIQLIFGKRTNVTKNSYGKSYRSRSLVKDLIGRSSDESFCPTPEDILPCTCYYQYERIFFVCQNVTSDELFNVFQQEFPLKELFLLSVELSFEPMVLNFSTNGISFEQIYFDGTDVLEIHNEFFESSTDTLTTIGINNAKLNANGFPFSILPSLTQLWCIELTNAGLSHLEKISSATIDDIHIAGNDIDTIEPGTFETPNISFLDLDYNKITELREGTIPLSSNLDWFSINGLETLHPGAFYEAVDNASITTYHLSRGNLSAVLSGSFLILEASSTVEVFLNHNQIQIIQPDAFQIDTNFNGNFSIYMKYNELSTVEEGVFEPLMSYITGLHLEGNPLECGCDIAWLVTNPIWMQKISNGTTCADGTNVHTLDPQPYEEQC